MIEPSQQRFRGRPASVVGYPPTLPAENRAGNDRAPSLIRTETIFFRQFFSKEAQSIITEKCSQKGESAVNFEENAQIEVKMPIENTIDEVPNELAERQVFAERLRAARNKAGWSSQKLAEVLFVDISTVSKWESGEREPGLKAVADIAAKLDVPADYLLGLTDSDGSSQNLSINDRAKAIIAKARDKGDEQALFFETTFSRYIEQIALLKKLKSAIDDNGVLIPKKNVKGDNNLVSNPALKDYVAVSAQANDTGKLLIRFVQEPLEDDSEKDELELFLSGR